MHRIIIQGGGCDIPAPGEGWTTNGYELHNTGNRVPVSISFPPARVVTLGLEATVHTGTLTIEFTNSNGVLQSIVFPAGSHSSTWNPLQYSFSSPATGIRLYFEGTGGYINAINLIQIQ